MPSPHTLPALSFSQKNFFARLQPLCRTLVILVLIGHSSLQASTDFDSALTAAKSQGKHLLVEFTGSDWCNWCNLLKSEVLDQPTFQNWAKSTFILVTLDFPKSAEARAKIKNPARNEAISQQYGVQAFPTILLIRPDGEAYVRTSYRKGGVDSYIKHLKLQSRKGLDELAALTPLKLQYHHSQDKLQALNNIVDRLLTMNSESIGAMGLAHIAGNALELDPENDLGLRNRTIKALLRTDQADAKVAILAIGIDPMNTEGILELSVMRSLKQVNGKEDIPRITEAIDQLHQLTIQDLKVAKELYTAAAIMNARFHKNKEKAALYAQLVLNMGVENPQMRKLLKKLIECASPANMGRASF